MDNIQPKMTKMKNTLLKKICQEIPRVLQVTQPWSERQQEVSAQLDG
jgi:hypothetical protein